MNLELIAILDKFAGVGGELVTLGDDLWARPPFEEFSPRLPEFEEAIRSALRNFPERTDVKALDLAISLLAPEARAHFESRAAILEHEHGMDRETAEQHALRDTVTMLKLNAS